MGFAGTHPAFKLTIRIPMQSAKKIICFSAFFALLLVSFFVHSAEREPDLTIAIPMRDGTKLPTDIYLSKENPKDCPVVLVRTPSGKRAFHESFVPLTESGYVVAIQDARNSLDRDGKALPWITDGWGELQDGYDTVEWLSKSPYSNGKVGTMGFSAMGMTQLLMAPTAPESLHAQYVGFAASHMYHHAVYMGGALRKSQVEGWLGCYASDPSVMKFVTQLGEDSLFWQCGDCLSQAHRVNVPALHYGGWYDTFSQGTIDAFLAAQKKGKERAKGKQILVMGPWTHHWPRSLDLGDFKIPSNGAKPPFEISAKRWFDFHLKGKTNEFAEIPPVIYYTMGPFDGSGSVGNEWRTADSWPVPSEPEIYYLGSENSLSKNKQPESSAASFRYDPANPVPTVGGRNLFIESGPKDQRVIEKRNDVIVFTSEPLNEDLEVTGRIFAKIYFETDKKDTDVCVRLMDVYPDGKSILVADGIRRLGTVEGFESGKPVEAEVDLWSTSMIFAKGHRVRISVSSSNFPQFDKNLNNGGNPKAAPEVAFNTVHFGEKTPSHIILPVVK